MTAYEHWSCDWHANPPEHDDDIVYEDVASEAGWVRIERDVERPSALGNGRTWRENEVRHVCADCLREPECRAWIEREGFKGYFHEDAERLALTATGVGEEEVSP